MSKLEERLWSDLLATHGGDLAMAASPKRREHKRALLPLTATALAIAAVAIVVVLSLSARTATPAYAVTRNPDGTLTVTINELAGISQANEKLERLGVRARARSGPLGPSCKVNSLRLSPHTMDPIMRFLHPTMKPFAVTIDPGAIPKDTTLLIRARLKSIPHPRVPVRANLNAKTLHSAALGILLARDPVPACAFS